MRQANSTAVLLLDFRSRQPENAQVDYSAGDGADVGENRVGFRQKPAADPGRFPGENPLGGQLDIKNVGVVFVHATVAEPRQSPPYGASCYPAVAHPDWSPRTSSLIDYLNHVQGLCLC